MDGLAVGNKLYVNISKGIVEVEGDANLVREVYSDFRERLLDTEFRVADGRATGGKSETKDEPKPTKRRSRKSKEASGSTGSIGADPDSPKLDKDIDTSGLAAYFGEFVPRNHSESILIFLRFLGETLGIEKPNTDQVFTCYRKAGQRLPKAFRQAFHNASSRHGYIEFGSANDLAVTTAGMNHFDHDLKRKSAD